ncbi:HAMP domain-containing histidine kinase [Lysobacter sp. GX 14042]|uniref:sensor histidine kinase n=1 Tax=Lysobacter sp. GX 14042 TaxID=2907155 RepID=UPI001F3C9132|nr:HAMP domain-containing sensor histidine kinase [Lysobacter sp. GX 14042]MCE7032337.1 HAMP domain-containing histidine kinase [Lysobacter sp. GX 14042]
MSQFPAPHPPDAQAATGEADEASRRQLQLFADAVAHDLRAPLRSIQSFSGLLESRASAQLDETSRDHLQRIRRAADRMDGLLTGLGELSQATGAELRSGPVDLGLLCDWALAELQDAQPERGAEVLTEGLDGLLAQGDERLLRLALGKLMDNAWRFTPAGEAVRIELHGAHAEGQVQLRIRDHGSGFDARYLHKIFQPFQRLHGPAEGAGHGLGLAVAQRIVERHGGSLDAESAGAGGATFHLRLPAAA